VAVAIGTAAPFVRLVGELHDLREWADRDDEISADLHVLATALEGFAAANRGYPARLEDLLSTGACGPAWLPRAETLIDPWGRPYVFAPSDSTRFLGSYGSDGVPGGTGEALDIFMMDPVLEALRGLE
jgi:hypothetical protein